MSELSGKGRWPDFLLIGAPKAGTTALFKALSRHPQIYACPEKEPGYFAFSGAKPHFSCSVGRDNPNKWVYLEKDYLDLFSDCPRQLMAGEASTAYLHHPAAPLNASNRVPLARLVVVLRHPVERAYSQWLHLRQEGHEEERDFEAACKLEQTRKARGWHNMWLYLERGYYAEHLERWLQYYAPEQILILFYEDWLERPLELLNQVCRHLGVNNFDAPRVTRENVSSRQPRWKWLHHRMVEHNALRIWSRKRLPLWLRDAITTSITRLNLQPGPVISAALRQRLTVQFLEDIGKLEKLTGRDLSHWKTPPVSPPGEN